MVGIRVGSRVGRWAAAGLGGVVGDSGGGFGRIGGIQGPVCGDGEEEKLEADLDGHLRELPPLLGALQAPGG